MNELIEKLILDATVYANSIWDDRADNIWHHYYNLKFAELIVQECCEVVKYTPSLYPNDEYVKNIKEHFGVEE